MALAEEVVCVLIEGENVDVENNLGHNKSYLLRFFNETLGQLNNRIDTNKNNTRITK